MERPDVTCSTRPVRASTASVALLVRCTINAVLTDNGAGAAGLGRLFDMAPS